MVNEYDRNQPCKLYHVDVDNEGRFRNAAETDVHSSDLQRSWRLFVTNTVRLSESPYILPAQCCVAPAEPPSEGGVH